MAGEGREKQVMSHGVLVLVLMLMLMLVAGAWTWTGAFARTQCPQSEFWVTEYTNYG